MNLWTAVLIASIICVALKTVGYLIPPRWLEAPRPARIADLLTVALLAALVAVQTLGDGQAVTVDARVPAVLVAAGLLLLRAPFLVVVALAAATAALLRLVGWNRQRAGPIKILPRTIHRRCRLQRAFKGDCHRAISVAHNA